jgi:hypothetical protein
VAAACRSQVKYATFAGLLVSVAAFQLQSSIGKRVAAVQSKSTGLSDERVRRVTEVLGSIQLLKVNGWERLFARRCEDARRKEVRLSLSRAAMN